MITLRDNLLMENSSPRHPAASDDVGEVVFDWFGRRAMGERGVR